jgi:hypothetical protein
MLETFGIIIAMQAGDPASEGAVQTRPDAAALVEPKRMARDASAKHLCPGFASKRSQPVFGSSLRRVERLTGFGIPLADRPVATGGEQGAAIGEERDRRARPGQNAQYVPCLAIDQGDGAANAGRGDARAVARNPQRDDRGRLSFGRAQPFS